MRKIIYLLASLMMLSSLTNCGKTTSKDYLCFTGLIDNSSIQYTYEGPFGANIQSSKNGKDWKNWGKETEIELNTDEKLYVRNTKKILLEEIGEIKQPFSFKMDGRIAASGNVMSMLNFGELYNHCFAFMFRGCDALVTPPKLPATKLADACYITMFFDCTNLQSAPKLPATTLAERCYGGMFSGCTSLIAPPFFTRY